MRTINPKKITIVSLKDSITEEYIAKEPYQDSDEIEIMRIWVEYEAKEGFAYGFAFITG